jgi:putative colanic acid biosynthesis acetyltransferase WcaF
MNLEFKTDLSTFNNSWYNPGRNFIIQGLWFCINIFFFKSSINTSSALKCGLLKLFGAKIGKKVVIKPSVNIKFPWKLAIGDFSWIGEEVWIDNLDQVNIGANVCISQGAMLLCGNHNYRKTSFDLFTGQINIDDGAWIGAKALVCPGVHCNSHSVLSAGSVATKDLEAYSVYQGNPAIKVKNRL